MSRKPIQPCRDLAPHVKAAISAIQAKPSGVRSGAARLAPHVQHAVSKVGGTGTVQRARESKEWNYVNIGSGENPFPANMFGKNLWTPLKITNVDPTYSGSSGNKVGGTTETLDQIVVDSSLDTVFSISPHGYDPLSAKVIASVKKGGWIFVAGNKNNHFFKGKLASKPLAPPDSVELIAYEAPGEDPRGLAIPGILKSSLRSKTTHGDHAVALTHFALYEKK